MQTQKRYFVYITTNQHRTVFYVGITNNLRRRMAEHLDDALNHGRHFTGRYQAFYLVWYEEHFDPREAIAREKQIKGWLRVKKLDQIRESNPEMRFLNDDLWDE